MEICKNVVKTKPRNKKYQPISQTRTLPRISVATLLASFLILLTLFAFSARADEVKLICTKEGKIDLPPAKASAPTLERAGTFTPKPCSASAKEPAIRMCADYGENISSKSKPAIEIKTLNFQGIKKTDYYGWTDAELSAIFQITMENGGFGPLRFEVGKDQTIQAGDFFFPPEPKVFLVKSGQEVTVPCKILGSVNTVPGTYRIYYYFGSDPKRPVAQKTLTITVNGKRR